MLPGTTMTKSSPEASWRPVALFGGAITANIPERFIDVSDFRPVPDHQEVLVLAATAGHAIRMLV